MVQPPPRIVKKKAGTLPSISLAWPVPGFSKWL